MVQKKSSRICGKGHKYYKSSSCPTCPVCAAASKPNSGFLSELSAPARRALEALKITSLLKLSKYTEKEIMSLHGMGPSTLPKLKSFLKEAGLDFKKGLTKSEALPDL